MRLALAVGLLLSLAAKGWALDGIKASVSFDENGRSVDQWASTSTPRYQRWREFQERYGTEYDTDLTYRGIDFADTETEWHTTETNGYEKKEPAVEWCMPIMAEGEFGYPNKEICGLADGSVRWHKK